jgi:uncharacterized coiled-coil protein SlyX
MRGAAGGSQELDTEHRLTWLEMESMHQADTNQKVDARMTRMERALIIIVSVLHALAHDRLPEWAKSISALFKLLLPT